MIKHIAAVGVASLLALAACGGSDNSASETEAESATTEPVEATEATSPPTTAAPTTLPPTTAPPATAPRTTLPPTSAVSTMPDAMCMNLQDAQDAIQASGETFFSSSEDATGRDRFQILDRNWVVVGQTPEPGTPVLDFEATFFVVKYTDAEAAICD